MLAHFGKGRHGVDEVFRDVAGVRGREADAPEIFHLVELGEEIREGCAVGQVAAVGEDVLAEEGGLAGAAGGESGDFPDDLGEGAAGFGAPDVRDDAVGAEVGAAPDDGDEGPEGGGRIRLGGAAAGGGGVVEMVLLELQELQLVLN